MPITAIFDHFKFTITLDMQSSHFLCSGVNEVCLCEIALPLLCIALTWMEELAPLVVRLKSSHCSSESLVHQLVIGQKRTVTSDTTNQMSQKTCNLQYVLEWTSVNRDLISSQLGIPLTPGSVPESLSTSGVRLKNSSKHLDWFSLSFPR